MKPTEWLRANKDNYTTPKEIIEACIEATGTTYDSAKSQLQRVRRQEGFAPVKPHPITFTQSYDMKQSIGLSESELRAKFDINFIVQQAAQKLEKGTFLSEAEFIKLCNLRGMSGYRSVIDHPDFKDFRGRAGGQTYWSHPESIQKLKNEGVLT